MNTQDLRVYINGQEVVCVEGQTILQVCIEVGIEIPHFCYHPGLPSTGKCHICFVSITGRKGLFHGCTTVVENHMQIVTESSEVDTARKETLKLLSTHHSADCAVCVRAGECDFQDIVFLYGEGLFDKRTTNQMPVKQLSSLIHGNINRCIGCLRCVSFLEEVVGTSDLGVFQQKEGMVIDTCFEEGITSELSGNLLDLCPSGALIENPFVAGIRPWEVKSVSCIDVMDAMGSSLRLDCREGKVVRVLPMTKSAVNQYWITDKARFSYDGLSCQRLDQPYLRKENGVLEPISWVDAFKTLVRKMSHYAPSEMAFLVGDLIEVDSVYLLRQLLDDLKIYNRDCRVDGEFLPTTVRSDYLFNTSFEGVSLSDACLIIGANIRYDAPLLNLRLRERYHCMPDHLAVLGAEQDLTFDHSYLGESPDVLNQIASGSHPFCDILKNSKQPMIILGMDALKGMDGKTTYELVKFIAQTYHMIRPDWNGFNVLHRAAGRVGALDMEFTPREDGKDFAGIMRMAKAGSLKLIYLLGVEDIPSSGLHRDVFVVYQGHHGDGGAEVANLILPGAAFSEKNGFYVNMEGRVQFSQQAVLPPGDAKEDWKIIRGLSEVLGYKLPYEHYDDVYKTIQNHSQPFRALGSIIEGELNTASVHQPTLKGERFPQPLQNYYLTNSICRASSNMVRCGALETRSKKGRK